MELRLYAVITHCKGEQYKPLTEKELESTWNFIHKDLELDTQTDLNLPET